MTGDLFEEMFSNEDEDQAEASFEDDNVCERCDAPAPDGQRFCSDECYTAWAEGE